MPSHAPLVLLVVILASLVGTASAGSSSSSSSSARKALQDAITQEVLQIQDRTKTMVKRKVERKLGLNALEHDEGEYLIAKSQYLDDQDKVYFGLLGSILKKWIRPDGGHWPDGFKSSGYKEIHALCENLLAQTRQFDHLPDQMLVPQAANDYATFVRSQHTPRTFLSALIATCNSLVRRAIIKAHQGEAKQVKKAASEPRDLLVAAFLALNDVPDPQVSRSSESLEAAMIFHRLQQPLKDLRYRRLHLPNAAPSGSPLKNAKFWNPTPAPTVATTNAVTWGKELEEVLAQNSDSEESSGDSEEEQEELVGEEEEEGRVEPMEQDSEWVVDEDSDYEDE